MKIAICEDDIGQGEMAVQYIRSLSKKFLIDALVLYPTGTELAEALDAGSRFDIYLLDIDLPGVNGLELAAKIRETQPYACIAFSTSYPQYVTRAFILESAQYFLKPIQKEVFLSAMEQMLRDYNNAWMTLTLENERSITLRQDEVVYVEFYHGRMTVWTLEQSYDMSHVNVKAWKRSLYERGFLQSHQGYFVNPKHIAAIETDTVICTDQISCPLSTRCRKDFMELFLEYMQ